MVFLYVEETRLPIFYKTFF